MLTLFHAPRSRSTRILWLLEELGRPFEVEYVSIARGDGTPASGPRSPTARFPHSSTKRR
jgi:glutathione S-transferase